MVIWGGPQIESWSWLWFSIWFRDTFSYTIDMNLKLKLWLLITNITPLVKFKVRWWKYLHNSHKEEDKKLWSSTWKINENVKLYKKCTHLQWNLTNILRTDYLWVTITLWFLRNPTFYIVPHNHPAKFSHGDPKNPNTYPLNLSQTKISIHKYVSYIT